MKLRRLTVEALESRAMLAADLVAEAMGVLAQEPIPGDANQDGRFDSRDIVQVYQVGKYLSGEQAKWSEGDWNHDGIFDPSDLIVAFQAGTYSAGVEAHGRAVTRPLRCKAEVTVILDLDTGTYTSGEIGQCTHFGRYTNSGDGWLDPDTGEPATGGGTIRTANDDEVTWEFGPGGAALITGGTGRFDGATGNLLAGPPQDFEMVPGIEPNTIVITYSYIGTGTITY